MAIHKSTLITRLINISCLHLRVQQGILCNHVNRNCIEQLFFTGVFPWQHEKQSLKLKYFKEHLSLYHYLKH